MLFYIKQLFLIVVLYIYIYSPPLKLLPQTPIEWLIPLAYLYILSTTSYRQLYTLFKTEINILSILIIYTFIRCTLSGSSELAFLRSNLFLLVEVLPIAFIISHYISSGYDKLTKTTDKIITNVIVVSSIAALISFYLIFNPFIAFLVNNVVLQSSDYVEAATQRCFGLSASLTYSYAIAQGIVAAIVLFRMSNSNKTKLVLYVIIFVLLVISVIYNARTGLVPILFMAFYLLITRFHIKYAVLLLIVVALFNYIFVSSQYSSFFESNLKWSMNFFTETGEFLTNDGNGEGNTYSVLLNDMMFLPDTIMELIVGTGERIFTSGDKTSDVGYVLQIFFGGLIYLSLLLYFVSTIYKRMVTYMEYKWFAHLFLFTTLICNIKGYFIYNDVAFRLLVLIYVSIIYSKSAPMVQLQKKRISNLAV